MTDPTHGRIDQDIQDLVEEMNPTSLGARVAMENTLQERRNRRNERYTEAEGLHLNPSLDVP